jgi:hypothetical protein
MVSSIRRTGLKFVYTGVYFSYLENKRAQTLWQNFVILCKDYYHYDLLSSSTTWHKTDATLAEGRTGAYSSRGEVTPYN